MTEQVTKPKNKGLKPEEPLNQENEHGDLVKPHLVHDNEANEPVEPITTEEETREEQKNQTPSWIVRLQVLTTKTTHNNRRASCPFWRRSHVHFEGLDALFWVRRARHCPTSVLASVTRWTRMTSVKRTNGSRALIVGCQGRSG